MQTDWAMIPRAVWQDAVRNGFSEFTDLRFQIVAIMIRDHLNGRTQLTPSELAVVANCPFDNRAQKRPFYTTEKLMAVEQALHFLSSKLVVTRIQGDSTEKPRNAFWTINEGFLDFISHEVTESQYKPTNGLQEILTDIDSLRRKVVQIVSGK